MKALGKESGPSAAFYAHVLVAAALATAAFMLATAADLGALGPLVIAEAFYLAAFAVLVEVGLAGRAALVAATRAISRRANAKSEA